MGTIDKYELDTSTVVGDCMRTRGWTIDRKNKDCFEAFWRTQLENCYTPVK